VPRYIFEKAETRMSSGDLQNNAVT